MHTDFCWNQTRLGPAASSMPRIAAAIGKMVRTREIQGKTTTQTSYYLLSTPLSAQRFTEVARAQWGIQA